MQQHLPDLAGADQQHAIVADAARLRLPLQLGVDHARNRVEQTMVKPGAQQHQQAMILKFAQEEREQRHREAAWPGCCR